MKKLNQKEKFVLTILAMVIIALTIITPVRKYVEKLESRIEELEYQLDSVGDNAYEAGYKVGFEEGYANCNQIEVIDEWFGGINVVDVIEEEGIGTIKIVDQGDNLWVITYEAE